jgi:hypothetical protein
MKFQKATKKQSRARIALMGPAGSGKTWNALELAVALVGPEGKIAVADSERGSASKYSDRFEFDVNDLESSGPEVYIDAVQAAQAGGYDVLIIDSWSHAWMGKDGILERVDKKGGFSGGGWRDMTPQHNRMVDAILSARLHVIVTLRVKTEYVVEKNDKGKQVPRKVGLAPVQKDGVEYEFDVVGMLDEHNNIEITKTRCSALHGRVFQRETPQLGAAIKAWLTDGAPMPETPPKEETPPSSRSASRAGATAKPPANGTRGPDDPLEDLRRIWTGPRKDAEGNLCGLESNLTEYAKWMAATFPVKSGKEMSPLQIKHAYLLTHAKVQGEAAYQAERAALWALGHKYGPEMNDLPPAMGGVPDPA